MSNCYRLQANLSIAQGEKGKSLEFMWEGTSLGVRVEGDTEFQFTDLGIEGTNGKEVQLQVSNGYIQWKYADEEEWKNLIAISELKGDRGLDGKSAYDLWLEKGNEGTIDDFLLSLKGKDGEKGEQGIQGERGLQGEKGEQGDKGDTGEQGLPGQNGVDGKDGITPNITIGTVTTLEPNQQATVENVGTLENPVFNFGIPKGQDGDGSGGTSIDDTTISTETTWSSSKIEDFVLTNDDVVWTEVSGENLSIDYTKEGHLREVEIWGNTVQDENNLEDIQHLGELYVNEEGEPIVDDLGREQYKIEIESCNKNLFDLTNILENTIIQSSGVLGGFAGEFTQENYVKIKPNTGYVFSSASANNKRIGWYDSNKQFIKRDANGMETMILTSPPTAKYTRFSTTMSDLDTIQIEEGKTSTNYAPHQSHKTTILLPCQLMKVGDVADRLYWDSEKGKYVVEKNIYKADLANCTIYGTGKIEGNATCKSYWFYTDDITLNIKDSIVITNTLEGATPGIFDRDRYTKELATARYKNGKNEFNISLLHEKNVIDNSDMINYLQTNNFYMMVALATPQLIETNVTEQILLPTYKDKTHIFVTGGIDGSIKCKVPLDGGQAILSLSQENKELKEYNQNQDDLINIALLATDEMYMIIEPLLIQTLNTQRADKMISLYVTMVQRGLKKIEDVPVRYREQVIEILNKLED